MQIDDSFSRHRKSALPCTNDGAWELSEYDPKSNSISHRLHNRTELPQLGNSVTTMQTISPKHRFPLCSDPHGEYFISPKTIEAWLKI
ncbi:MAG: hypothetical protein IPP17_30655 [Bacteroidetes bacterium]|nr:hypothetical protein [Bacteroidota bacterium]